jgi:hypothetical protein
VVRVNGLESKFVTAIRFGDLDNDKRVPFLAEVSRRGRDAYGAWHCKSCGIAFVHDNVLVDDSGGPQCPGCGANGWDTVEAQGGL